MNILKTVLGILSRLVKQNNGVFYINGPDTLPPPLSAEEEAELLARLETDRAEVCDQLIVRNLRLVVYIAKKFDAVGASTEDLISIGTIGLIKAVRTFSPQRNIKLATYASRCIENEILMYIRKTSRTRLEVSIDEPLNTDWDGNELLLSDVLGSDEDDVYKNMEYDEDKKTIADAISTLSTREQTIVRLRRYLSYLNLYFQKN